MYQVLDVREHDDLERLNGWYINNNIDNTTRSLYFKKRRYYSIIAENLLTNKRVRFDFYDGYQETSTFKTIKTTYYGYKGDFALLMIGDKFDIVYPSNEYEGYTIVQLINPDNDKKIDNAPTYYDTANIYYGSES